ncbi:MAG TPA: hypothetical protein VE218_14415 [Acidobacteriaceae bacterium]|nr:hypothetical protein [Acidobacteriaceae bacterium]
METRAGRPNALLMNYLEHDAIERNFPGLLTGVLGMPEKPSRRRS